MDTNLARTTGDRRSGRSALVLLVVVVLLLAVAGTAWLAVWSIFVKPRPVDGYPDAGAAREACAGRRAYFPDAAPYDGRGPHAVRVMLEKLDAGSGRSAYSTLFLRPPPGQRSPAHLNPPKAEDVQLIACLKQTSAGRQVESCEFDSGPSGAVPMYAAAYAVTVYEARTGERLGTNTISDAEQTRCPGFAVVDDKEPKLYAEPSVRQVEKALSEFTSVAPPIWPAAPQQVDVLLEVEGKGKALIVTWAVPTSERMHEGTQEYVKLPWRMRLTGEEGWFVSVRVGMPLTTGPAQPEATCRVSINGKEVRTETGFRASCDHQVQ
ncbi:hypothetical protein [Actinopolymorpha alba]|uniref:hypothetical protein n=1 Tax=Actinopolymorpha alba TaxID=533267 RepID=UPI00036673D0|nr:hypothetical protein [Actinopolymorpha alba]